MQGGRCKVGEGGRRWEKAGEGGRRRGKAVAGGSIDTCVSFAVIESMSIPPIRAISLSLLIASRVGLVCLRTWCVCCSGSRLLRLSSQSFSSRSATIAVASRYALTVGRLR